MRIINAKLEAAVNSLVDDKFKPLIEKAEKERGEAGDALYIAIFGGELDYINSLRHDWYLEGSDFRYHSKPLGGMVYYERIFMSQSRRLPVSGDVRFIPKTTTLEACEKAYSAYKNKEESVQKFNEDRRGLKNNLMNFGRQFRTLKRLEEQSEELASYYKKRENIATTNLPAVTYDQIISQYPEIISGE